MTQRLKRARSLVVVVAAALLAAAGVTRAGGLQSSSSATKIDVERLGPQVGARLPDFVLRDQRGQTHSLKSLLGPKGAMIVFFRSADW